MKKLLSVTFLLFGVIGVVGAQDTSIISDPMIPYYIVLTFIIMVVLLVLFVAIYMLKILNMFIEQGDRDRAEKAGIAYVPRPSWWQRIDRKLTDAIPLEKENTILLDHNYDGIRELDNHLPPWWKWLFYATIVWSGVYLLLYHVTDTLPLSPQEFDQEMALAKSSKKISAFDEGSLTFTTDPAILSRGKDIFISNCASCHQPDGGGGIGPNLTDNFFLHGNTIGDVYQTVKEGVPNTNMIAWKASLSPEKIRDVSNFVLSLLGTSPVNPKAPQGNEIKDLMAVPADSTQSSL